MAEEVEMIPVEAAEPPKANPLSKSVGGGAKTIKLASPQIRRPGTVTQSALRPGLKLPGKPGLAPGLKLPPKPGLAPGLKLPSAPVIRKPGDTIAAPQLPKPVLPKPIVPKPAEGALSPAASVPAAAAPQPKEEAVDKPVEVKPPVVEEVKEIKPLDALKSATQKLKGVTQPIPPQAILRKTGIIADTQMSEAQKEASKHKTARISLSDAIGVAPVNNENQPMKTIRIKRPIDIPGVANRLKSSSDETVKPDPAGEPPKDAVSAASENPTIKAAAPSMLTQRKTLKISRPQSAVRPTGKFTTKRATAAKKAEDASQVKEASSADNTVGDIPEIPNIPDMPAQQPQPAQEAGWVFTLSSVVQLAACGVIGALAWYLYQNTQTQYF